MVGRNGAYPHEESSFSCQSPTNTDKPSCNITSAIGLLRNPSLANNFLRFATAVQCRLGSLYVAMTLALIRDCWAQQQQIWNAKSRLMEELTMKPSIRDRALEFVDSAISLQTATFKSVERGDSLFFAERVFRARWDSLHRSLPCRIDIAYHLCKQGDENIRSYLDDIARGEGLFCSSNPSRFHNQGDEGDTVIVIARIRGIDHIEGNTGETTKGSLKGFYTLCDSKEYVPLFQFSWRLLEGRGSRLEKQLMYFQVRVQHLLETYFQRNNPTVLSNSKDSSMSQETIISTAAAAAATTFLSSTPINIRNDDRASRRRFMQNKTSKAYKAHCANDGHNKEVAKHDKMVYSLPKLWSRLETPGMRAAKCSLLVQKGDRFAPRVKSLSKQRVFVYQDRGGNGSDKAIGEAETNEDDHFVVDFEGCKILQFEPLRGIRRQMMPTTLTVGGRCVFTAQNYREFRVMMRTKAQSKEMGLLPNGDFDWPDVDSLRMCPCCGRIAEVPKDSDDESREYWLVFYPLLQMMSRKGSRMVLGSRMICRLTCLECMRQVFGETTCKISPALLNERRATTSFTLSTNTLLAQAGSVSFLEGGPPRPDTHPNIDDVLDAWSLYNLWETSGAWDALQNDYQDFLSKIMT